MLFGAKLNEPKSSQFFLDLENQSFFKKSLENDKPVISVVPCDKTFLHPSSPGTKKYKKITGAKFRGCYPIEERLLAHNEVRHEPFDNLSSGEEQQFVDDPDELPTTDKFLTTPKQIINYHIKSHEAYHKQHETWWTESRKPKASLPLNPLEIGVELQRILNKLEKYCQLLTPKQKEAVKFVYLQNEKGLSGTQVAKKLKISLDSLKDRLDGALKRIKEVNPLFKFPERRMSSERAKNWESPDSEFDGFYRKSNSGANPVRVLDPNSLKVRKTIHPKNFAKFGFGKKKKNPKANKKAITKWALEMTPSLRYR